GTPSADPSLEINPRSSFQRLLRTKPCGDHRLCANSLAAIRGQRCRANQDARKGFAQRKLRCACCRRASACREACDGWRFANPCEADLDCGAGTRGGQAATDRGKPEVSHLGCQTVPTTRTSFSGPDPGGKCRIDASG